MKDEVIVITGGASGIGRETAKLLAADGAKVIISDINEDAARKVAEEIKKSGEEAVHYKCNVAKKEEVQALVEFTVKTYGTITGYFNNAGIGAQVPFLDLDPDEYHRVVDINQSGVYYGLYYAANKMKSLGVKNGKIVNTASIYGFVGAELSAHYNATKAAVVSLTKSAAQALTKDGIRVTGVAPGFTRTAILEALPEEALEMLKGAHLRGKLLEAIEIAQVAKFLFSDESVAINGSTVLADDGFLAVK